MNFLVDAQLPKSLSDLLNTLGYHSIHTFELPDKNITKDSIISELSSLENRIVVTKDTDFLESYLIKKEPEKLLLVRTGNIKNSELLEIFNLHIPKIAEFFEQGDLIEVTRLGIILHI